ncbi:hypothetical protein [Paraburkholderia strydomiana]|uniref:hypothetical protein n=1 Tax=Paraburkholderia strydomiana TaxID=1245417 RepID=UPI001BECD5DF|nr:hypothetical protein [Paraburkholderia strydomiana]MBT2793353.1 hypothetical protein [Paraburkholderia strydomiana]
MKIQFIEDGNFTSWLRLLLIVLGITFAAIAVECNLPILWARILLLSGFAIALVGGMTSRAQLLQIKPFENSYKNVRKSYRTKSDEERKS